MSFVVRDAMSFVVRDAMSVARCDVVRDVS